MERKRYIFLFLIFVLVATAGYGQRWKLKRYELTVGMGVANYYGDVGGSMSDNNWLGIKDLEIENSRPAYSLRMLYWYRENLAAKMNFTYAQLQGTDLHSKLENRDMSFRTSIFETSFQVNYRFYKSERTYRSGTIFNRRGMLNNFSTFQSYAFTSLGATFFNVKDIPDHILLNRPHDVNLDKRVTLIAPVGIGLVYVLNANWQLGFELGGRFTLTNYLDGFATQWSTANDVYSLALLQITYRIKTKRNGYPDFSVFRFW